MSEIHSHFTILFNDRQKESEFIELMSLLETDQLDQANDFIAKVFGCNSFISGEAITIEKLTKHDIAISGYINSGTISFNPDSFNELITKKYIEAAIVNYFYDQVGESEEYSSIKGKESPTDKAIAIIAKSDIAFALALAVKKSKAKLVEELLDSGADANGSYMGCPVICHAALGGRKKIVQLLLDNGSDPNAVDRSSEYYNDLLYASALHYAVYEDSEAIVKMLLENGADPNIKDAYGNTPIVSSLQDIHMKPLSMQLIKNGADLNSRNNLGQTPIALALERLNLNGCDDEEGVKYLDWLVKQDFDINVRCNNGGNLRWYAGSSKEINCRLLAQGLDKMRAPDNAYEGIDAHFICGIAIEHADYDGFRMCIENYNQLTPCEMEDLARTAVICDQLDILKLLVEMGANTNPENRDNNALVTARDFERREILSYLNEINAESVKREEHDIIAVNQIYTNFVLEMVKFTKEEGDLASMMSLLASPILERFDENDKIGWTNCLTYLGWGYTQEYQQISFEHDGRDCVTVVRQNHTNGWPKAKFKKLAGDWKIIDIADN